MEPFCWNKLADAYAFFGNTLLRPMTQTSDIGLDPSFWESFPDFGSEKAKEACRKCADFAERMKPLGIDAAKHRIAVEYTALFIGPPSPAAEPWETFYQDAPATAGFGQPAHDMARILAENGLSVQTENNQYPDHIGIELLCLSVLCRSAAAGGQDAEGHADDFARVHPLAWIAKLESKTAAARPEGYYRLVIGVVRSILEWQEERMKTARGRA